MHFPVLIGLVGVAAALMLSSPAPAPAPNPIRPTIDPVLLDPALIQPPPLAIGMRKEPLAKVLARQRPRLDAMLKAHGVKRGDPVFLRLFKTERLLEVWMQPSPGQRFRLVRALPICAWSGRLGPKQREGDFQSPEGFYLVRRDAMNPASNYHLSFNVGFPNAFDRSLNRTGSFLMVHGDCASVGCYAIGDGGIEEVYTLMHDAFAAGQPFVRVHLLPWRMAADRAPPPDADVAQWGDFWDNLAEGQAWFEREGLPPDIAVNNDRYTFSDGR